MINLKNQTKANSVNGNEIAGASTVKNGQLIRIYLDILALNILLFQNQDKSPPGTLPDPDANPVFFKSKEKNTQKNHLINSHHI